jgi:hypothetical protein
LELVAVLLQQLGLYFSLVLAHLLDQLQPIHLHHQTVVV